MSKASSSSFVHEFSLKTCKEEESEIETRFQAARNLRNACLSHCLKLIVQMRASKAWQEARNLGKTKEAVKKRRELYRKVRKKFKFSEYNLHRVAAQLAKNCWIGDHLDSHVIQKVATAAYHASDQYLCGKRGRPRFKSHWALHSVEGKSNKTGIRFKDGVVIWNIKKGKKLTLNLIYDFKDKHGVEAHSLGCKVKYVRLVRRVIRGKAKYFAQLILEGKPHQKKKNIVKKEYVGLDIGPSTVAAFSLEEAFLGEFCTGLSDKQKEIRTLQKKMERSKRATNKSHFCDDGTVKKGRKKWVFSKKYKELKSRQQEIYRKLSTNRRRLHGELANQVLAMGNHIKVEKLSYRSFQKNYGKSVGAKAPGMFVSLLSRKAESAGGKVEEFSTYKTALSQVCQCGKRKKKLLSERWHTCECGIKVQRDLYSSYLAYFVENETLNTSQTELYWPVAEPLLEHAVLRLNEQAKGKARLSSFGLGQRQSPSHVRGESPVFEAVDVVGAMPRATEIMQSCL